MFIHESWRLRHHVLTMSNAPASDCGTLSRLCSRTGCSWLWCRQQKRRDTYGGKLHRAWFVRKKCCVSSYAGCGLVCLHIRRKKFTVAPPFKISVSMFPRLPRCDVAANQLSRNRLTFSKSLMVSVAVSKLGCSGLMFVAATTMMNCCCNDCCQRSASSAFKSMRFCRLFPCVCMHFFMRFRNKSKCVFVVS